MDYFSTRSPQDQEYNDWRRSQLYVKGEFVGGSDIMMEMFESGELKQLVGEQAG